MTSIVKHSTRKPLAAVASVASEKRLRNGQLRTEFPPRSVEAWWPYAAATAEQVQQWLTARPLPPPRTAPGRATTRSDQDAAQAVVVPG